MTEKKKKHGIAIVGKDGVLRLSKKWVQNHQLAPGKFVDETDLLLRRKGVDRRAFIRFLISGISLLVSGLAIFEFGRSRWENNTEANLDRARRLLGFSGVPSVALLPARNHPFMPLGPNEPVYPIEAECCRCYREAFWKETTIRTTSGVNSIRPEDSTIIIGSQVSNLMCRRMFGNPFKNTPSDHIRVPGLRGKRIPLRWNLYSSPNAPVITRHQYGVIWQTKAHSLVDLTTGTEIMAAHRSGVVNQDILLITVVPRKKSGPQNITILYGIHGVGTLATALLFMGHADAEFATLDRELKGRPYYQALFDVEAVPGTDGESKPSAVKLRDVVPLEINV